MSTKLGNDFLDYAASGKDLLKEVKKEEKRQERREGYPVEVHQEGDAFL